MTQTQGPPPDPAQGGSAADSPGDVEVKQKRVAAPGPRAAKKSMSDLLVGTVLADRYRLNAKVGEGAMGWVFAAEHVEIGKKCAVKVLRPSLCRVSEAVSRFRREARAASSIGSKHIVDVTDFGQAAGGAAFFVMEYLEGEDLAAVLARDKTLPWSRACAIARQLCEALQAAHDAGIFHRDIKPANCYCIAVDGDDFIKVLDFGIARLASPKDSIVTRTGVVMGTPDFMAPEQAQGRHVDHRADIYSLGATLFALLTGRPPFTGKNEYDVIYKQLNEPAKAPSSLVKEIPAWLDAAVLKALRKDPEERFASMSAFAAALVPQAASERRAEGAPPPSPTTTDSTAAGVATWVWAVGFALLVIIGGLLAFRG